MTAIPSITLQRAAMFLITVASVVTLSAACSSDDGDASSDVVGLEGFEVPADGQLGAQIASYELVSGRIERFMVGLVADEGDLVGFGAVGLDFAYIGTREDAVEEAPVSMSTLGIYRLVAGQDEPRDERGPRHISPSEGLGVYRAELTFDRAGFWAVQVTAEVDGDEMSTQAVFEVLAEPINPFPGEPAPRTVNRLAGDATVPATAIDSRAAADGSIPDPSLHDTTIESAVAARRPVMVVVSTPTFCISRFCGPITDSVAALDAEYGDQMDFVHIEVWNDFENSAINREAAEWIYQEGADPREPWVFLIDADGAIADRWGNVVTDSDLADAVDLVVGT